MNEISSVFAHIHTLLHVDTYNIEQCHRVSSRKKSLGGKLDMAVWHAMHALPRGVWGHAPPGKLSSMGLFLVASETTVTENGRVLL